MTLDSASVAGPSPMQALAFALAGCMAMDVVHVLTKGRHEFRGLRVAPGRRARAGRPAPIHRMHAALHDHGDVPADAVERAIALSREKYCSVWHSMRQDIELTVTSRSPPASDRALMSDASTTPRVLDWARGIAVLIMIQAHVLDSWTRARRARLMAVRVGDDRRRLRRADVSVPRRYFGGAVRGSKAAAHRRSGGAAARGDETRRPGSSFSPSSSAFRLDPRAGGPPRTLLRVDILNIMGPSIVAAAALWGAARSARRAGDRRRRRGCGDRTADADRAGTPLFDPLPDPIEAYIRPISGALELLPVSRGPASSSPARRSAFCSMQPGRRRRSRDSIFGSRPQELRWRSAPTLHRSCPRRMRSRPSGPDRRHFSCCGQAFSSSSCRSHMRGRTSPFAIHGARSSSWGERRSSSTGFTLRWCTD